jgi:hypothetical protein
MESSMADRRRPVYWFVCGLVIVALVFVVDSGFGLLFVNPTVAEGRPLTHTPLHDT